MKILVYGFKPYGKYEENITERVVALLKKRRNLETFVFPVEFKEKTFLKKLKKINPDIVLGLGQCKGGKKIRIERKASNVLREEKGKKTHLIDRRGEKYLFTPLKLSKNKDSVISYDAGKYVCNFSMYIINNYCRHGICESAFLHIPNDYNLKKAVKFVESKIDKLASE